MKLTFVFLVTIASLHSVLAQSIAVDLYRRGSGQSTEVSPLREEMRKRQAAIKIYAPKVNPRQDERNAAQRARDDAQRNMVNVQHDPALQEQAATRLVAAERELSRLRKSFPHDDERKLREAQDRLAEIRKILNYPLQLFSQSPTGPPPADSSEDEVPDPASLVEEKRKLRAVIGEYAPRVDRRQDERKAAQRARDDAHSKLDALSLKPDAIRKKAALELFAAEKELSKVHESFPHADEWILRQAQDRLAAVNKILKETQLSRSPAGPPPAYSGIPASGNNHAGPSSTSKGPQRSTTFSASEDPKTTRRRRKTRETENNNSDGQSRRLWDDYDA